MEDPIKDPTKTRFDAVNTITDKPAEMIGYYFAEPVYKTWKEDITDGDTGEIITIDRRELLFKRGASITPETAASLTFLYEAGEINGLLTVTDQRRAATEAGIYGLRPYSVVAAINRKSYKFILQAQNVDLALEVARDWIELNYDGEFLIKSVTELNNVVILNSYLEKIDPLGEAQVISNPDSEAEGDRFYKAEAEVKIDYFDDDDPGEVNFTFLVKTADIDTARSAASAWIANRIQNDWQGRQVKHITTTLTAAVPFTCTAIINRLFCEAYKQPNN